MEESKQLREENKSTSLHEKNDFVTTLLLQRKRFENICFAGRKIAKVTTKEGKCNKVINEKAVSFDMHGL